VAAFLSKPVGRGFTADCMEDFTNYGVIVRHVDYDQLGLQWR